MPAGGNFGSIAAKPAWTYEEEPNWLVVADAAADGTMQSFRSAPAGTVVRKWRLHFDPILDSQIAELKTFLSDNEGVYSGFTWTNPTDLATYNVRFESVPRLVKRSANRWTTDVVLVSRP